MDFRLHTHKQFSAAEPERFKAFKLHEFEIQPGIDRSSQTQQQAVDWQTQLRRAKDFGHNLSQIRVQSGRSQSQDASAQAKLPLQRKVVEDEQKEDREKSALQMKQSF